MNRTGPAPIEVRALGVCTQTFTRDPDGLRDARDFARQWNTGLAERVFEVHTDTGEVMPCCTCNPARCATTDDACLDMGCTVCVHGCPSGDTPCCRETP